MTVFKGIFRDVLRLTKGNIRIFLRPARFQAFEHIAVSERKTFYSEQRPRDLDPFQAFTSVKAGNGDFRPAARFYEHFADLFPAAELFRRQTFFDFDVDELKIFFIERGQRIVKKLIQGEILPRTVCDAFLFQHERFKIGDPLQSALFKADPGRNCNDAAQTDVFECAARNIPESFWKGADRRIFKGIRARFADIGKEGKSSSFLHPEKAYAPTERQIKFPSILLKEEHSAKAESPSSPTVPKERAVRDVQPLKARGPISFTFSAAKIPTRLAQFSKDDSGSDVPI